jgi:2-C-methyl-D-erythritol 2,4-cyclodiphosphate synthase
VLLKAVAEMMQQRQQVIGNLDATVVAQAPKLAPYLEQMKHHIADDLSCDASQVNIKATTTERLGFVGREEGIEAHAVVLLVQASSQNYEEKA